MKRKSSCRSAFSGARVLTGLVLLAVAGCLVAAGTLLAFVRSEGTGKVSNRTLTFAERVGYQRAIEEVYWRHRIWPGDRPDPKPSLDTVMPRAQIEKKVTDYLRKSQWIATNTTNAPSARYRHTAVWNGNEMIIWGGTDGSNYLNTGRRYNPNTDSWTPTTTANAPLGRAGHTAVWTGTEMIVWGVQMKHSTSRTQAAVIIRARIAG